MVTADQRRVGDDPQGGKIGVAGAAVNQLGEAAVNAGVFRRRLFRRGLAVDQELGAAMRKLQTLAALGFDGDGPYFAAALILVACRAFDAASPIEGVRRMVAADQRGVGDDA